MKTMTCDKLTVKIFPSREEMGREAAKDIKSRITKLLSDKRKLLF